MMKDEEMEQCFIVLEGAISPNDDQLVKALLALKYHMRNMSAMVDIADKHIGYLDAQLSRECNKEKNRLAPCSQALTIISQYHKRTGPFRSDQ